jgi:DNA-binding transcriptional regulator YiaG
MYILFPGGCKTRTRINSFPFSRYAKTTQKPHPQGYPEQPKTIGEHLKKKRMDLGLYQAEAARLLDVSEDCLCYWENERNKPRLYQYPAIIAFLGYYPFDHEIATFGGKIRRYKYEHGLSNEKLATLLEVDEGTVANWERNKRLPLARSLNKVLSVIVKKNAAH